MRVHFAVALVALTFVGCAKKQPELEVSLSPKIIIEVTNNYNPPDQVQIFVEAQTGARQLLGVVSPGRKGTFNFQPTNATDKFTLVAQTPNGTRRPSQAFTLVNAQSMTWDLRSNTLQIFEP